MPRWVFAALLSVTTSWPRMRTWPEVGVSSPDRQPIVVDLPAPFGPTRVAVVTDSTVSLPESLLESLNIRTVAYYLHRGHEVLRDLITIQRDEFLRWLPTARVAPTTAAPGPGDYLETYEELAAAGVRDIISIHMGAKLSAAFESATAARRHAEGEDCPRCAWR